MQSQTPNLSIPQSPPSHQRKARLLHYSSIQVNEFSVVYERKYRNVHSDERNYLKIEHESTLPSLKLPEYKQFMLKRFGANDNNYGPHVC